MKQKNKPRITLGVISDKIDTLTQTVGGLARTTGGLVQDVAVLKQDVGVLKQDMAMVKEDIKGLHEKTDDIIDAVQTLSSDTDRRFDRLELRIENRFNTVDSDHQETKRRLDHTVTFEQQEIRLKKFKLELAKP